MNKKNGNRARRLILLLAVVAIVISAVWLISDYRQKQQTRQGYESLAEVAHQTTETLTEASSIPPSKKEETTEAETEAEEYVSPIDFEALAKKNSDVIGWITIPGTKIDYPIVHTDNNETYLNTDFDGNKSVAGSVYLDCDDASDFSSMHNILYGHNMKNGTMFKDIIKYKEEKYFKEHQDIYIYTPEREIHLKAMSVLYTEPLPIRRKTKFTTAESFAAYVEEMTKGCAYRVMPGKGIKQLYSFVTCSYEFDDARTILYAYEVEE